jgi:hypothetical protein
MAHHDHSSKPIDLACSRDGIADALLKLSMSEVQSMIDHPNRPLKQSWPYPDSPLLVPKSPVLRPSDVGLGVEIEVVSGLVLRMVSKQGP